MKVSTKFEVDMTIRCIVIELLLLIRYVTLWPWPLTFWPWSVVMHGWSRGQPLHQVWRSYCYTFSSYEFWHLPHWQCVCSHCACAVSCDLCVGGKFSRIFEIPDPDLPTHYATFMALRLRQMELSAKTKYGPVLKITQLSAHAHNHVSIERCRKSFTTIVLGDHDFPWIPSNFGNMTSFRATFNHIFTAHAQKRLFINSS